jgi:isopenicillin-N epimerase
MRDQFLLDPQVVYLNHGSFGATPKPVFERYQFWQRELERQPTDFIGRRAPKLLSHAREVLAQYFNTSAENIVFMTNVTFAINAVARSIKLCPGDEVLASNQEYGAMDHTWLFLSRKQGFKYINDPVSLPVTSPERYVDDLWQGVNENTRVIFISHISSPTSVIAPVKEICQRARSQGIITVIDGAHVPGQIPLDLTDLPVDFYGGNLHKWLCAPKGAGFLYAAPRVQHLLEPLIVSYGWEDNIPDSARLVDYFQYIGTRDYAAFLAVPDAIEFQNTNHWDRVREKCHNLAKECLIQVTEMTGASPLYSPQSNWFAQMVTIPLPDYIDPVQVRSRLLEEYHIEIPVIAWNGHPYVRVSFQAYNSMEDLEILLNAIRRLIRQG